MTQSNKNLFADIRIVRRNSKIGTDIVTGSNYSKRRTLCASFAIIKHRFCKSKLVFFFLVNVAHTFNHVAKVFERTSCAIHFQVSQDVVESEGNPFFYSDKTYLTGGLYTK